MSSLIEKNNNNNDLINEYVELNNRLNLKSNKKVRKLIKIKRIRVLNKNNKKHKLNKPKLNKHIKCRKYKRRTKINI